MLVVSQNLYLFRSHISALNKGLSLFFPVTHVCHETLQGFVLLMVLSVLGSTMLLFLYLFGFVKFFHCFGSYACTDTSEYIGFLKEERKTNLPLSLSYGT